MAVLPSKNTSPINAFLSIMGKKYPKMLVDVVVTEGWHQFKSTGSFGLTSVYNICCSENIQITRHASDLQIMPRYLSPMSD